MVVVNIDRLIGIGVISREYKKIGCCYRTVLKFTDDDKQYYYKYGKPLSKILLNKISNPLYRKMVSQSESNTVKNVLNSVYAKSKDIVEFKKYIKE
jgi:hypothetical protein